MPEPTTVEPEVTDTETPKPTPPVDPLADLAALVSELGLEPGHLKARLEASKKWETRAKENAEKATEYDKFVESQKTEQQKLEDAKATAERLAADTAAELARMKAAVKHGLSEDDLELLGSGTPEEIEARAERLAARLKGTTPPAPETPKAPPSDAQGAVGAGVHGQSDPLEVLDAQIAEATKAGKYEVSIALKQQRAALVAAKKS